MKSKLFYVASRREGYGPTYAHACLALYPMQATESCLRGSPVCEVQWQSDTDQEQAKWYGPHLEFRSDSDCGLDLCSQLAWVQRVAKAHPLGDNPIEWAKALEAGGIPRYVYDQRIYRYLPLAEVKPASFRGWITRRHGWTECMCRVLAEDENEARRELTKEMAARVTNPGFNSMARAAEEFAEWQQANRPVEDEGREMPDLTPLEKLFEPLGKKRLAA